MRALAGAVLSAGAMTGLGLTAIGFGYRYSNLFLKDPNGNYLRLRWGEMDPALMMIMITLMIMTLVGLGITFLGLAYHHERQHREWQHLQKTHTTVGASIREMSGRRPSSPRESFAAAHVTPHPGPLPQGERESYHKSIADVRLARAQIAPSNAQNRAGNVPWVWPRC